MTVASPWVKPLLPILPCKELLPHLSLRVPIYRGVAISLEKEVPHFTPESRRGYLDNGIQLVYNNTEEGKCLMLRIESLEIDDHILEKIESKHGVSFEEVEETCLSEKRHVRKSREGLYKLFGRTAAGRYVLVVLANLAWGEVAGR